MPKSVRRSHAEDRARRLIIERDCSINFKRGPRTRRPDADVSGGQNGQQSRISSTGEGGVLRG